jgi:hypothetical protein
MFGEAEQEEARHPARQGAAIAIFSYSVGQNVSRGAGQSAVKVAAYQGRKNYIDERTGYHYNYQPREHGGIAAASAYIGREGGYDEGRKPALFVGLYAPEKAPGWCRGTENVEHFWNRLEVFERRVDAQIAERHIIALPHELTLQQNIWALQDFVRDAFTRQGRVVQVAIHAPEHGDGRNIHAHLLISIRGVNEHGFNASKEAAQDRFRHRREYVQELRALWAETANRHLGRHGHEERIDHRTLAEQGIKREPTMHLGPGDSRRERQGERSAAGEVNREVAARNAERQRQALDRAHEARHHEPLQREAAQEAARPREAERPSIARREATPASGGPQHVRRGPSEGSAADDPAIREIDAWRAGIEREWQGQGSPVKPIAPDPQRAAENARLEREALLDRRADGKPRSVRETAFELSPDYRQALREVDGQKGAVAAAERRIKGAERSKEVAEYRVAERRQQMPGWRQALHKRGWVPDRDLGHWEGRVKAAERGIERGITHRTTARDALAMWERRADAAFEAVRPAVERELTQRQDRAKAARAELARRGLWISEPEHVGDGQERDDLAAWHGFRLAESRKAVKDAQKAAPKQVRAQAPRPGDSEAWRARVKPAAAVQFTRPMKSETEEKEEAAQRYVRGLIERERSRPEYAAEEEQKQVKRQRQGFRQRL